MAKGGSFRSVADGVAKKGNTKGKQIKMAKGGMAKGGMAKGYMAKGGMAKGCK